ncbi:MAG: hypothetical protein K2Y23_02530 [Cyanobacteria bacterium]|nr:hypothetical protein [Cyanobacteriota bacterium]
MHAARAWLAAASVVAIVAAACSGSPSSPTPAVMIPLQSSAWETISDPQPFALANDGAALTFEFPSSGSINYLFTAASIPNLHGTLSITVRITTSGPVIFNSLDPQTPSCTIPSSVRPFIWANGNGNGESDRWWSNPRSITLAAGTQTLNVPLTADAWSNVNGKFASADGPATVAFGRALLNLSRLGLTFGGGCSFGHGINVQNGTARFAITEYAVR